MTYLYEKTILPAAGLRLHLNEHTGGCSPAVLEALRALTAEEIAFYPDYTAPTAAVASHLGVSEERLVLTNGLDEGILAASIAAIRGWGERGRAEAIVVVPAFDMQAACAETAGARVVPVPLGEDFEFPLDGVRSAITGATRIVFITTPNNPTGISAPREAILSIAAAAPQAMVFVDEAYVDFGGATLATDVGRASLPNLVVGRTFAKAHGLAGIRCGVLIGSVDVLSGIRRVLPPYSLNVAAAVAIPAALNDLGHYERYLRDVRRSRQLLYEAFDRLGVRYWRSDANFVLARVGGDAEEVCRRLAERGVHVRNRSNMPGCDACIRITAGVVDHTRRCIAALEEVLCAAR